MPASSGLTAVMALEIQRSTTHLSPRKRVHMQETPQLARAGDSMHALFIFGRSSYLHRSPTFGDAFVPPPDIEFRARHLARRRAPSIIYQWECPPCLERKARPKRNPHPPSSLGGAARAGDGVPTSAGGPVPRRGRGQPAGGGRSREPDRGVAGAGKAGVKRSSSSSSSSGKVTHFVRIWTAKDNDFWTSMFV